MTAPALQAATADDTPEQVHPEYDAMAEAWTRIRDLQGGTDTVRKRGTLYLPKHDAERDSDYQVRLRLGVLFNGFVRTLNAMTGLVTHRDVMLGEDVKGPLTQHWENIDGRGTHGAVFARRLLREGLAMGSAGILVDPPIVESERPLSRAEEATLGVRPYWRRYRAEDIRDWAFREYAGQMVLSHLVLRECYYERASRFKAVQVTDYRVYTWNGPGLVFFERWREVTENGKKKVVLQEESRLIIGPKLIPFAHLATDTTSDDDPFVTRPPLLDLADLNLCHYRTDTDRRNLMRLGCLPVPVRKGYQKTSETEPPMAIGPNVMVDVPTDGDFGWAEVTGGAFEPTGKDLEMLEKRMAALGLAFLQSDTRQVETAEAKRLDTTAQNASLSSAARALQDCLETAAGFHAEYTKTDPGSIDVNFDFERTVMDPGLIATLNTVCLAGNLSQETFLGLLHRGRVLGDEFDVEEEIARIMEESARIQARTDPKGKNAETDDDEDA
jgi:hypothetical protein